MLGLDVELLNSGRGRPGSLQELLHPAVLLHFWEPFLGKPSVRGLETSGYPPAAKESHSWNHRGPFPT